MKTFDAIDVGLYPPAFSNYFKHWVEVARFCEFCMIVSLREMQLRCIYYVCIIIVPSKRRQALDKKDATSSYNKHRLPVPACISLRSADLLRQLWAEPDGSIAGCDCKLGRGMLLIMECPAVAAAELIIHAAVWSGDD